MHSLPEWIGQKKAQLVCDYNGLLKSVNPGSEESGSWHGEGGPSLLLCRFKGYSPLGNGPRKPNPQSRLETPMAAGQKAV